MAACCENHMRHMNLKQVVTAVPQTAKPRMKLKISQTQSRGATSVQSSRRDPYGCRGKQESYNDAATESV
jgi:hypothetical protein